MVSSASWRLSRLVAHAAPVSARGDESPVIYLNGKWVADEHALVSIHDVSFTYGYGVFDTTRTYGGRLIPERVTMHLDRFFQSIAAVGLRSPLSKEQWREIMEETVRRNQHLLLPWGGDFWVFVRLTPGYKGNMTLICEPVQIPMGKRRQMYLEGISMNTVSIRRVPHQCVPPRAKVHSYLNNILADLEAQARDPYALALMQDMSGNIAEGSTYNFFIVQRGCLLTPREQHILAGVSRQTVIDLAGQLGVPSVEKDLDMYDVYNAEEAFLTSTSLCLCPIKKINGRLIGQAGELWGAVSSKIRDAYIARVGVDFVAQYLSYQEQSNMAVNREEPSAATTVADT